MLLEQYTRGTSGMQNLPDSVLSQLLATVRDQESRCSLFGACKLLRDLTLAEADGVQCLLDVSTVTPTQAARSLQLLSTCKEGAAVKLVLQDPRTEPGRGEEQYTAQFTSWLNTLCTEHGSVLEPITHLELKAHVYGMLVPAPVKACCPKMTHFSRWGWIKDQPNTAAVDGHTCGQLHHLTLLNLGPTDGNDDNMSVQGMQQQFSLLPNLQSLYCLLQPDNYLNYEEEDECYQEASDYLMDSIQPMRAHLKTLTLPKRANFIHRLCVNAWPQLQHLIMPEAVLRNKDVKLLLSKAPQVTELQVSELSIRNIFAGRECRWRHLTINTTDCRVLAMPPISGLSTLSLRAIAFHAEHWSHMPAVTSALSGLDKVEAVKQPLEIRVQYGFDVVVSQVPQLVAMLQSVQHSQVMLVYYGTQLPLWLQVLEQLHCRHLTIYINSIPEDCWGTLLQQLPQLEVMHLKRSLWQEPDSAAWLDGLTEFCQNAPRCCTLHVDGMLAEALPQDWHHRLESSMYTAGHQRVTIQTQP